ncbi:hypothetical protein DFH94DRAFT_690064 [Russula ochroleuca]|uniref:Uncharacterized protein n=1 Tax=Russula ochroleuca TaxID=152965 RepID=A0A9P5N109_9AGAM|nr:hypothetical protein DFH94DRAFT_690064 [Russula ochroleuca]
MSNKQQEQSYSIQPHPAKSNDPADLAGGPQPQPGHAQAGTGAFHARDPHVPSEDILSRLEQPKTREELRARAAELNSGK